MIVTNNYKLSSNIDDVIRSVFLRQDFVSTKKHKKEYKVQSMY